MSANIEHTHDADAWFVDRVWSTSANRLVDLGDHDNGSSNKTAVSTKASSIFFPKSTQDVASLIQSHPDASVAVVCGGHEVSNAALVAGTDAIVLDLKYMKDLSVHGKDVTVSGGVVFEELAETVHRHGGALPVGTGKDVGVIGYLVNGGISGYFSRRLGLLGQRVQKMTVVDATGTIQHLTPDDGPTFYARLGAGSALGVVTEVTLRMDDASILKEAKQFYYISDDRETILQFSRWALGFMRDVVLPNESVAMECVIGSAAVVITFVFYETYEGSIADVTDVILAEADTLPKLTLMQEQRWTTWFDLAKALWPIISQMEGSPLASMNHCCGTQSRPTNVQLEFVADTWIAEAPLEAAESSIVEVRTLGGAIRNGPKLPSGNFHNEFFVDLIVAFDAGHKSAKETRDITERTTQLVQRARSEPGFAVDFSGTHCQADNTRQPVVAAEIFGDAESAQLVLGLKQAADPSNHFCFHPFAKVL